MNPPKRKAGVHAGRGPLPVVHQPLYPWVDYCNLRAVRKREEMRRKGRFRLDFICEHPFLEGEEFKGGENLTVMKLGTPPLSES